jgi:hypothetical protein
MAKKKLNTKSSGMLALSIAGKITAHGSGVSVIAEVVQAIVDHLSDKEFEEQVTSQLKAIRGELRDLRLAIDKIPLREYSEHLATGRRCLADLRDWRKPKERTRLLNEARTAFRTASGIARVQQDTERELVAELAMAGCWYAESALDDVRATLRAACELAESDVLRGDPAIISRYAEILSLCGALNVGDASWTPPAGVADWSWGRAVITLLASPAMLVQALGIRIRIGDWTDDAVRVELWNDRWSAVEVGLTYQAGRPWFHDQPVHQGQALAYDLATGTTAAIAVRLPASAVGRSRGIGPTIGFLSFALTPPLAFPSYPTQYPQY